MWKQVLSILNLLRMRFNYKSSKYKSRDNLFTYRNVNVFNLSTVIYLFLIQDLYTFNPLQI